MGVMETHGKTQTEIQGRLVVLGWDARRKDVLIGAKKDGKAESYFVHECPRFERG